MDPSNPNLNTPNNTNSVKGQPSSRRKSKQVVSPERKSPDKKSPDKKSPETASIDSNLQNFPLELTIGWVKHVTSERYPIEVYVRVFFKQMLLATTPTIIIRSREKYDLNFEFTFKVKDVNNEMMDSLLSEPFLFVLTKSRNPSLSRSYPAHYAPFTKSAWNRKKRRLIFESRLQPKESSSSINVVPKLRKYRLFDEFVAPLVLGEATLDLLPMLQGNKVIEEELKLERPSDLMSDYRYHMRPLLSRTMLHVKIEDMSNFTESIPNLHNYLVFGVESLYHVDTVDSNEPMQFVASIPLPLNVPSSSEERDYALFHFEPGILKTHQNIEYKHKWHGLANSLGGRAVFSQVKIPPTYNDIKTNLDIDVKTIIESDEPRVNWNIMRRVYLPDAVEDVFLQNILKYRCLPVEVIFAPKNTLELKSIGIHGVKSSVSPSSSLKKPGRSGSQLFMKKAKDNHVNRRSSSITDIEPDHPLNHYVAFLDISGLLFAGATKIRVASQLQTYSPDEYEEKWMVKHPLLKNAVMGVGREWDTSGSKPIYSASGKPVFIIVEISLMKPLISPKEEIQWESIGEPIPVFDDPFIKAGEPPLDEFATSICYISELIKRELGDFNLLKSQERYEVLFATEIYNFHQHLTHSGALQLVKETLRKHASEYVRRVLSGISDDMTELEKKATSSQCSTIQDNNIVGGVNAYFIFFEKITQIVNTLQRHSPDKIIQDANPLTDELLLYAVEAAEQLQYDKTKYYLAKRMEGDGYRNPDFWLDYGIMALRFGDLDTAVEAMKEVIMLDIRHKMGLLTYAMLMTILGNLNVAELFFYATIEFHPTFWPGWIAFYLFYEFTQYDNAPDLIFMIAFKYMQDLPPEKEFVCHIPILSWFKDIGETDDPFIKAAIFYLEYNLFEFAELAIAQYLARNGKKDIFYHYYLAVAHFVQGRYDDCVNHLNSALSLDSNNTKMLLLLGLSYHNLNDHEQSRMVLTSLINKSENYEDFPLALVRLGFDYLEKGNYEVAKDLFKKVITIYQTPLAWTGLGISYYLRDDHTTAELAFTEANAIDRNLPMVWSYLALIYLHRFNYSLYNDCLEEAKRSGLKDERIFEKFELLQESLMSMSGLDLSAESSSLFENIEDEEKNEVTRLVYKDIYSANMEC